MIFSEFPGTPRSLQMSLFLFCFKYHDFLEFPITPDFLNFPVYFKYQKECRKSRNSRNQEIRQTQPTFAVMGPGSNEPIGPLGQLGPLGPLSPVGPMPTLVLVCPRLQSYSCPHSGNWKIQENQHDHFYYHYHHYYYYHYFDGVASIFNSPIFVNINAFPESTFGRIIIFMDY